MEGMKFGKSLVEEAAAALYHSFHGTCECTAHPFFDSEGVELPWTRFCDDDDSVVVAFREAALAAQKSLLRSGVGKYRKW
jgi:hypothetical protein